MAVDGWMRSSCARSPTLSDPSAPSSTTSARNCGRVTVSSTAAIDRDATATSARDASEHRVGHGVQLGVLPRTGDPVPDAMRAPYKYSTVHALSVRLPIPSWPREDGPIGPERPQLA